MSFRFVQAAVDLGPARGPRLAVTWHMAEGGGTVEYLSKPNPNGVSVHYVIRNDGVIVQMLPLDHMQGSIRPTAIRDDDDAPYDWEGIAIRYGRTAAHAVMGKWADTAETLGPNHASIGVEVEGYAAAGPNGLQRASWAVLWAFLEDKYPGIRSLGHRDFQDYKACPGHRAPWHLVGGHGPLEVEVMKPITTTVPKLIDWPDGTQYFELDGFTPAGTAAAVTDRLSPFGCGTQRAFYRGDKQLALVTPSAIHALPDPVTDADCAATVTDLRAQLTTAVHDARAGLKSEAVDAIAALKP